MGEDYDVWNNAVQAAAIASDTLNNWSTNLANEHIAKENREYQYNTSVEFWNMQNEYNSPKEAMQRLREAGINPFVAAAQVANVNHAGEMSTPTQQALPYVAPPSIGSEFSQMASALAALASARNTDMQTEELKGTLASKIERDILQTDSVRLQHELDLAFKPLERSQRMRELKANISKLDAEANLAIEQGNLASMQYQLANAQRYLTELKADEQLTRNSFLESYLQAEIDELLASIKEHNARAYEATQSGNLNAAEAALTNEDLKLARDIHDDIVVMEHNRRTMTDKELVRYYETHEGELSMFMQRVKQSHVLTQTMQVQLESAITSHDWQTVHEILDVADQAIGVITRTNKERSQTRAADRSYQDYDDEVNVYTSRSGRVEHRSRRYRK